MSVLLIDDSPEDQELVREAVMVQARPVQVEIVSSGQEGLARLRARAAQAELPDVVLLDIQMPGMNGFEVLRAIREDPALARMPVVFLTTSGAPEDRQRGLELHMSAYLVKAMDFQGFERQVTELVQYWLDVKVRALN
ncbi:response regulator [Deinococcus sp. JMULE3]|nr:response regulator [Deinococcus sp. JMULE3]